MSTSIRARVDALERANGGPGEPPLVVIILTALGAPPDAEAHMSANVHGATLESEPGECEAEFIERAIAFEAAVRPIGTTALPFLVAKVPAAVRGNGLLEQRTQRASGGLLRAPEAQGLLAAAFGAAASARRGGRMSRFRR